MNTVYFIQAHNGGPIKIGITCDIKGRFTAIQKCCPVELIILGIIESDDKFLEGNLHVKFNDFRLHGEWFADDIELLNYIKNNTQASSFKPKLKINKISVCIGVDSIRRKIFAGLKLTKPTYERI